MNEEKKKLTFWQWIENFWYYYKWRVITALLLVVVIVIGADFIDNNTDDTVYDLTVLSVFAHPLTAEEYDMDNYLKDITKDANGDGVCNTVLRPYYITEKHTSESDLLSEGQFEACLKKAVGDVMILDVPNLNFYLKKDIFEPIDKYVDLSTIPAEDIVYKNDIPVAVKLRDSKILKDMAFIIDEIYASVVFVPDDADDVTLNSRQNAKDAILKLLEK